MIEVPSTTTQPVLTTREQAAASDGPLIIPIEHVTAFADPLTNPPWGDFAAITISEVRSEAETPTVCDHVEHPSELWDGCRACDIRRIAHFVVHGLPDTGLDPILVDVGVGTYYPSWPLLDGNHRIAAAVVRGEKAVTVEVAGDLERAYAVLIDGRDFDDVVDDEWDASA